MVSPEIEKHNGITKKSCVNYRGANITSLDLLEQASSLDKLIVKESVSDELLTRIREGAEASDELDGGPRELLRSQGLID